VPGARKVACRGGVYAFELDKSVREAASNLVNERFSRTP
jgi:hypothetical protein